MSGLSWLDPLISCSTVVRLSLFAIAGVYAELPLLMLASGIALIGRYLST